MYMYLEVTSIKENQLCVSKEFIFFFFYFFFSSNQIYLCNKRFSYKVFQNNFVNKKKNSLANLTNNMY